MKDFAIVIPSRLESTRLPNKPLIKFNGVPMIIHVALTCMEVINPYHVFVSSPNSQIVELCKSYKIKTHRSSIGAKSGTDRLVEFIKITNFSRIINVQGDELLLEKKCLADFIANTLGKTNPTIGIAAVANQAEIQSSSVVKIAHSDGKLIYASRSIIPSTQYSDSHEIFKQTGLYMYTRESLLNFSRFNQGNLEKIEKIEILRLVENRISVDVMEVRNYHFTIDTETNVADAKTLISRGFKLSGQAIE